MQVPLGDLVGTAELEMLRGASGLAAAQGMRVYLVGGSVRDLLLGRVHADWDLVVEGDGHEFAQVLAERLKGRLVLHQRFLTAELRLPHGEHLHIATARRERYLRPGALPLVEPASIEEDLWRRDFAINAMALSLQADSFGAVLDPTGGQLDLKRKRVRALHARSFWDDATRIVRAIGFEQRLSFHLETDTEAWLREAAQRGALETVSSERLGEALLPLLANRAGPLVLRRGAELGVTRVLGDAAGEEGVWVRAVGEVPVGLEALGESDNPHHRAVACLVSLLVGRTAGAEQIVSCLHLDRPTARELRGAQWHLAVWAGRPLAELSPGELWVQLRQAGFGAVMALWLARREARAALVHYWRELRDVRPDFAAQELRRLGYRPGPAFGEALVEATRVKLNRGATREEQLAAAVAVLEGEAGAGSRRLIGEGAEG